MRILALETSEISGSLAIGEISDNSNEAKDLRVVAAVTLPESERSARSLAPAIDTTLRQTGWTAKSLDVLGLSIGPGSFTGLRVGLATARMVAWAIDAKIVAIDTRDAIAQQFFDHAAPERRDSDHSLTVWIDAQRGQVVTATYRSVENSAQTIGWERVISEDHPISMATALANLPSTGTTWLAGSILRRPSILAKLPETLKSHVVEPALSSPNATGVLALSAIRAAAGEFDELRQLSPFYSRPSAATERLTHAQ